jgi:hypothetical protein
MCYVESVPTNEAYFMSLQQFFTAKTIEDQLNALDDVTDFHPVLMSALCAENPTGWIEMCVAHGADVNLNDGAALRNAVYNNNLEAVVTLLKAGAYTNITDHLRTTPLFELSRVNERSIEILAACCGAGANLFQTSADGLPLAKVLERQGFSENDLRPYLPGSPNWGIV